LARPGGHAPKPLAAVCPALVLTAFFLLPIYLIAIAAISTPAEISAFPRRLYPRQISLDTLLFFSLFPVCAVDDQQRRGALLT